MCWYPRNLGIFWDMTGCWQPVKYVVICPEMVDSLRIHPGFGEKIMLKSRTFGFAPTKHTVWISPPYWGFCPKNACCPWRSTTPHLGLFFWRFLFLSVITRRTLTVSWCRCPSSWQPSIFHHFSVFRGSFGKVSCLAFSLFARLCTRTELNSGLCCAADCIGDGSALGPAVRAVWIPIWLWLTVCHGKIHHAINRWTIYKWAIYTMAMLKVWKLSLWTPGYTIWLYSGKGSSCTGRPWRLVQWRFAQVLKSALGPAKQDIYKSSPLLQMMPNRGLRSASCMTFLRLRKYFRSL